MKTLSEQRRLSNALAGGLHRFLIPTAIYTVCFFAMTYPHIRKWTTDFYCDGGDGLQNEWNIWWIKKAIVQLHTSPWYTTWLHAPRGTTLIGHTLNPINGLIGIPLSLIFSPVVVYNLIVTGCFVFSGVTAFWLAEHVTHQRVAALFGGFAFTFTGFHFAHAYGHMQLISTEFLPLFLLTWIRLLEKPSYWRALAAGVTLGLVALCDFYYVLYCVVAGIVFGICYWRHLRSLYLPAATRWAGLIGPLAIFVLTASVCCGPLIIGLLVLNSRDPLHGEHADVLNSADALGAFVPGEVNLLGRLTQGYWSRLNHNLTDESIYIGISVCAMGAWGIIRRLRTRSAVGQLRPWVWLAIVCYLLSLGPILQIGGVFETPRVLPYQWMATVVPPLKLSGIPARFTVMLALATAMLASIGVADLCVRRDRRSITVLIVFAFIMMVDLWPINLPTFRAVYPPWTLALRKLPLPGAVITQVYDRCPELYCQTLYDRPRAFGYISRTPQSVSRDDLNIVHLAASGNYQALHDLGFVYLIVPREKKIADLPVVYSDWEVVIQRLPGRP